MENSVTEDPTEISQHFHSHFSKIGETIAQNASNNTVSDSTFKNYLKKSTIHTIMLDPPQPNEIFNTINSLNLHKFYEHDNILSYFFATG